jgi:hypothetical protein
MALNKIIEESNPALSSLTIIFCYFFSLSMETTSDFSSSYMKFYSQICLCEIRFTLVQLFYYFLANMVGFYGFETVAARNGEK